MRGPEPKRKSIAPYLKIAASVLVVFGVGFGVWQALRPKSNLNDGLNALQAAYRQERPVEARVSDFNYVPLPNQRGGTPRVDYVQRDLAANLLLKSVADQPSAASHHAAGKYYLLMHQFEQANQEFTAALALEPSNAKIHNDFGAALLEEGRTQNAEAEGKQLELFGRSLEQFQKALDFDNNLLEARFNRALLLQYMRPSDQAKAAWNEYLERDNASQWADEARRNLKLIDEQRGDSKTPSDYLLAFMQARRESNDAAAWKVLTQTYTSGGNQITNQLLDALLEVETSNQGIDANTALPALLYVARLEQAHNGEQFTSELVNYYSRAGPKLKPILANARRHMRSAYSSFEATKFAEAIRDYTKAKLSYEQAQDKAGQVFVEYRLAHCYVLLRPDAEKARLAFSRLLTIAETNQYRWLMAQCLYGLAHASIDSSEYSKAIEYSDRALEKFQQSGDVNGVVKTLVQLADFNQAIGLIGKSLNYLSRASQLADSIQTEPKQRWGMLNQIGFSMTSLQLYAAALFYQKEALSVALEAGAQMVVSRSYGYVGSAYAAMKLYRDALIEATHAFEIGEKAANDLEGLEIMANASLQLGDIYREAGNCDKAIENYDRSLDLYRKVNADNYNYAAQKGKLHCFIAVSNNPAVRKELESVLNQSEFYRSKLTTESERNSFFDMEQGVYDLAISYEAGKVNDYVRAFKYSEESRARSLLDAVKLGVDIARKQGEISLNLPVVSSSLSLTEIQNRMPASAQIVEYAMLDDRLVIWVVTKEGIKHKDVPVSAEALSEKVSAFLEMVNRQPNGTDSYLRDRASELFKDLIAPVEEYLDKLKTLCIVADKTLNYLPFAALLSPATGKYLVEEYDLGMAASGSLLVKLSEAAAAKNESGDEKLLAVGNPKFNRDVFNTLRDLPASSLESTTVSDLYPQRSLLLRDDATETAIKREIGMADVAHFAMHFVLNERSEMLSGFPVTPEHSGTNNAGASDGFLQSYEIYGMNLRRLRLVVLSACQTGIERQYKGEGAVGAARPFLVAGVPTVVASLWPVDSDASAELMVKFHQHRRSPLPVTQALRRAQIELLQSKDVRLRHPYYWAAFVAIGGLTHK